MFFTIIGIILCLYGFCNFRKGFLYLLIFRFFIGINLPILPFLPAIKIDMVVTAFYILLFFINGLYKHNNSGKFPLKIPFILLFFSWTISSITSYIGFVGCLPQYIGNTCKDLIFIWIMWEIVRVEDIKFLVKNISIVFLIACLYAVYEHFTISNPLRDYELSWAGGYGVDWQYFADDVRGYRIQSIFDHAIGAGANFVLYIIFILTLLIKYNNYLKESNFKLLFLCFFCALSALWTNSRTPVMFLLIGLFAFLDFKSSKTYFLIIISVFLFFMVAPLFSDYSALFTSIFNPNSQATMYGSNSELRFDQLAAAFSLFMMSPIHGLGFMYYYQMHNSTIEGLLGMESIWFNVLPELGIIGVIANLCLAYYSLVVIPKKYKSKSLFFLSLAYWIVASLTSLPGIKMYFYYLIMFYFIKLSPYYKLNNTKV